MKGLTIVDMIIIDTNVEDDGLLTVQLPPDAPRGLVRVTIEKVIDEEATPDAELDDLFIDSYLDGEGLTAEVIASSPEFGMWEDQNVITDGETYVENIRGKRYIW